MQTLKVSYTSNFLQTIRSLKPNKVYTYVGFDSRGFPYRDVLTSLYMRYVPVEDQNEAYLLICKDKGKYKKTIRLHEEKEFLLYEGAVLVNTSFIVHTGTADWDHSGHCRESKRWEAYDTRYLVRALNSAHVKPFIWHYRSELKPEILLTCQVMG